MRFVSKIPLRPSQLVLIGDQLMLVLGLTAALLANYRILDIEAVPLKNIILRVALHLCCGIAAWIFFKVYKKVIRFFHSGDYLELLGIVLLIHTVSMAADLMMPVQYHLGVSIFVLSFLATSMLMIVSRFMISYLYLHYSKSKSFPNARRIIIFGSGDLAVFLKKSITGNQPGQYRLIAFADDDPQKVGRSIGGIKVIDISKELRSFVEKEKVTDIIIAKSSLMPSRKSEILEMSLDMNLRVREVTSVNSLISGFNFDRLSSLDINDLMNREAIKLYEEHVHDQLKNKTALVTGAAGSIGSEIVRKLAEHRVSNIVCIDFSESALYDLEQEVVHKFPSSQFRFMLADIRNEEMMETIFRHCNPSVVYHAAAYKHVPMMELFPWQAIQTNVEGTRIIAQNAIKYKADRFVFISSDKAVNPTSVMGATKRLAEMLIQSFASRSSSTSFAITRFGNVLGSNGSVVPLFKKQISEGGPVTVTHPEMTRYFMTISEACQLVLEASVMAEGGEIFVFDMGKPVKIVELAKNMIRLAGYVPGEDIQIEFIGQRPGEKLYEDLFSEREKLKDTYHEKIMISNESPQDGRTAEFILARLQSLEGVFEPALYRKLIKEILPEYMPEQLEQEIMKIKSGAVSSNPATISNIAQVK